MDPDASEHNYEKLKQLKAISGKIVLLQIKATFNLFKAGEVKVHCTYKIGKRVASVFIPMLYTIK